MKYDKYLNRINKLNKVLNALYRLRFVIASVVSITVVGVLTFEFTKGIVKVESFDKLTYSYGDVITASSKAFANSSEVQYKTENGGEWSSKAPVYPGEYLVRAISKNGFGSETTSDVIKFTIMPKDIEVSISQTQVTYGELPNISASLIGMDKITTYQVEYDNEFTAKTNVKVDKDSVTILDKNGKDVTFCYNVIEKKSEINILPRPLTLTFKDNEKIYDGKEISEYDGEISSGTLASGDEIIYLENETHQSSIGEYSYDKDFVIKHGDIDVTDMYSVNSNKGKLTINKIPLTAYSLDYCDFYNAKTLLENDAYQVKYDCPGLIEGHKVNVIFEGEYETYKDEIKPLETTSVFRIDVTDKDGNNVNDLYQISLNYGNITVSKREITINFGSLSKPYDAVELSCPLYDVTGNLFETDIVRVEEDLFPKITTPDVVENIVNSIFVYNEAGDIITDFYNITLNSGCLEITKPNIKFNMPTFGTITYDGEEHLLDDFSLCEEESDEIDEKFEFELINEPEICLRAGTYVSENEVRIWLEDMDVTDCFNVLPANRPESVILPRELNPQVYFIENNDTTVTYNSYEREIGLKFNDGEMIDTPYLDQTLILNAGTYTLSDLGFDILDENNESVYDCYKINNPSYLVINQKEINIVLPNANYVYDGQVHYIGLDYSQFVGDNAICDNDYLTDYGIYAQEVGDYTYSSDNIYCTNMANYIFNFDAESKTSTIEKRKIELDFNDFSGVYNGKDRDISFAIKSGSLAFGDSFVGASLNDGLYTSPVLSVKNTGTYNKSHFSNFFREDGKPLILNADGYDVTDNYEIVEDFDKTKVEVKPYELEATFVLQDESYYVYNGAEYFLDDVKFNKDIIDGHYYEVYNVATAKRAGSYINQKNSYIEIFDEYGENVTSNYQIKYNYWESLNIKKADVEIIVNDFTPVYDGLPFSSTYSRLVDGFTINTGSLYEDTVINYSIKDEANSIFITNRNLQDLVDITIYNDEYGENTIDDYNLTIVYGKCDYIKRDLYFQGINTTSSYNGNTPANLRIEPMGDEEFYARHNIVKDAGAIYINEVNVGKYDLHYDLSKWHIQNKNAGSAEVNNFVNFHFSNLERKANISQRRLTLTEKADTLEYGDRNAKESFKISNLLSGHVVYIEVNGLKEKVTTNKIEYEAITDMYERTPYGTEFYYNKNGVEKRIDPSIFKVYMVVNDIEIDITSNYSIEIEKENAHFYYPIYIK